MPAMIPIGELQEKGKIIHEIKGYLPSAYARYIDWNNIKEPQAIQYTSPEAMHAYNLAAIRSYVSTLANHDAIPRDAGEEISQKLTRENVTFLSADEWESILRHDVRGLVRACQDKLSEKATRWLYLGLTSYDVINTAQSAALRDVAYELIIPEGVKLGNTMIRRAKEHRDTVIAGRTHRQHAAATTVGHWIGETLDGYVPALNLSADRTDELKGKIQGFVGTRAAPHALFRDRINPRTLETETLAKLGLEPSLISSQVLHPYHYAQYFFPFILLYGSMAKFANDVRNFQQTEVGEIYEARLSERVGSSTGATKRNPITSENIGGHWRQLKPKVISILDDYITDFQRDLQDSANKRYYMNEVPQIVLHGIRSTERIANNMTIRADRALQNLGVTQGLILGEPLQLYLQVHCAERGMNVDTHEHVRLLADRAIEDGEPFFEYMQRDSLVRGMLNEMHPEDKEMLLNPEKYLGTAKEDMDRAIGIWERDLDVLSNRAQAYKEMRLQRVKSS
ncbi:MAG: hypothetical protein HY364_00985 [Candidatus Aenigmarchaeota archaeon]|nr:hypothetical protein [Candidatus Aenigmarchaeota archaeon]